MYNCEWVASISALAIAIAKGKTPEEIAFLSRLLFLLSSNLSVLSTAPPASDNDPCIK